MSIIHPALAARLSSKTISLCMALGINLHAKAHESTPRWALSTGAYWARHDYIAINPEMQTSLAGDIDAVVLHEIGHWTGHPDRLDRPFLREDWEALDTVENRHTEEMTAQLVMVYVAARLGFNVTAIQAYLDRYAIMHVHANMEQAKADALKAGQWVMEQYYAARIAA